MSHTTYWTYVAPASETQLMIAKYDMEMVWNMQKFTLLPMDRKSTWEAALLVEERQEQLHWVREFPEHCDVSDLAYGPQLWHQCIQSSSLWSRAYIAIMARVWILITLFALYGFVVCLAAKEDAMLLSAIPELHFHKGKKTTSRRTSAIQQLQVWCNKTLNTRIHMISMSLTMMVSVLEEMLAARKNISRSMYAVTIVE